MTESLLCFQSTFGYCRWGRFLNQDMFPSSCLCHSRGAGQETAGNSASALCHTRTSDRFIIFFVFSSHFSKLMEKPFCLWPKQTLLKLWALSWALLSKFSILSWCSKLQRRTLTMNFEDGEFWIPSAFCFKAHVLFKAQGQLQLLREKSPQLKRAMLSDYLYSSRDNIYESLWKSFGF